MSEQTDEKYFTSNLTAAINEFACIFYCINFPLTMRPNFKKYLEDIRDFRSPQLYCAWFFSRNFDMQLCQF